jgi:Tfp pilus assembly PilM family ATPase
MSLLTKWLASPPPDAAIEIAADRVAGAVVAPRSSGLAITAHASEPLRAGIVTPSLIGPNIQDRNAAIGAIRRVLEKLGTRPRRVGLIIPDTVVKVSLLRFETVPQRRDDFDQLVRWQLRKAAPFPMEAASVTSSPGMMLADGGREFVVEVARDESVREYESLCEDAGVYAGLVDSATFSLLGVFAATSASDGDWLLVQVRPDYTSIAIVRGDVVIFYRNRPEDGQEGLADLVHQTSMYYQDRLEGAGFTRAYLAGAGGVAEAARRSLEERLGVPVETLDPTRAAALTDRISASPELMDAIGPSVGLLRRSYGGVAA